MAGTGAGNAAVKKMIDFIEGGAEGNELSEGLRNRLLTVAQSVSVDSIPSPINKTLTGRTFRHMADKMEKVSQGDIEILADWLEEEYPNALASFQRISLTVDFTPAGGKVSSAIAETRVFVGRTDRVGRPLAAAQRGDAQVRGQADASRWERVRCFVVRTVCWQVAVCRQRQRCELWF